MSAYDFLKGKPVVHELTISRTRSSCTCGEWTQYHFPDLHEDKHVARRIRILFLAHVRDVKRKTEADKKENEAMRKRYKRASKFRASKVIVHRSISHRRTYFIAGRRERAFADLWEREQEPKHSGRSLLEALLSHQHGGQFFEVLGLTNRDAMVAATVIQWLGTNCGFDFLSRALAEAGERVVRKDEPDFMKRKRVRFTVSKEEATMLSAFQKRGSMLTLPELAFECGFNLKMTREVFRVLTLLKLCEIDARQIGKFYSLTRYGSEFLQSWNAVRDDRGDHHFSAMFPEELIKGFPRYLEFVEGQSPRHDLPDNSGQYPFQAKPWDKYIKLP